MLHAGLDLSRRRLDVCVLDESGATIDVDAVSPDRDALRALARRFRDPVHAVIESMNGARFVHDELELAGWDVAIADPQKARGIAPLACKTDRIDAWVLAELSRRDFVPEIWLPDPTVRGERELVRWRLHLVRHRVMLKNRIHATLMAFGKPCPLSDLFGVAGRQLLARLDLPEPWMSDVRCALELIDDINRQVDRVEADLAETAKDHRYVPLLRTAPGVGLILGFTIASEIGDIARFATPKKLVGYTGLRPRVYQSGDKDHRGNLAKNGPRYLRWAMIEAAVHASHSTAYRDHYQRTRARLGKQRGPKIARIEVARKLTEAIWHMLTKNRPFAPTGPTQPLVA